MNIEELSVLLLFYFLADLMNHDFYDNKSLTELSLEGHSCFKKMFFKVAVDNQKDLKDLYQSCCFFLPC